MTWSTPDTPTDGFIETGKLYQLFEKDFTKFLGLYEPLNIFCEMEIGETALLVSAESTTYASFINKYHPETSDTYEFGWANCDERGYDWGIIVGMLVKEKIVYQFFRREDDMKTCLRKLK